MDRRLQGTPGTERKTPANKWRVEPRPRALTVPETGVALGTQRCRHYTEQREPPRAGAAWAGRSLVCSHATSTSHARYMVIVPVYSSRGSRAR